MPQHTAPTGRKSSRPTKEEATPARRGRPSKEARDARSERVKVIPDVSLMTKIGRQGYSLAEMLAEFADNSIDARVENHVDVDISIDGRSCVISDNAFGMTKPNLIRALTIAHSTKQDALGEYGIGMKAAAVAMANAFSIQTSVADEPTGHQVEWNVKDWLANGQWEYKVETRSAAKNAHGTTIRLTDLKFAPGKRIGLIRNELGRRFGPFIRAGELTLRVNGAKCHAPKPDLLKSSELTVKNPQPFELQTQGGQTIHGWVGLMTNSSQKGLYGFDTFRRGRLITYNDKMVTGAHPTVARVVGEVHLDHVPVTSNKRQWIETDPQYEDAVETLKAFVAPWLSESRRLSGASHNIRAVDSQRIQQFKDGIAHAFQTDELRPYTAPAGGQQMQRGGTATEVQLETRAERSDKGGEHDGSAKSAAETDQERTRHPRKLGDRAKTLKVGGKQFDYEHKFGALGADAPWMAFEWNNKNRHLSVISNQDSPIFRCTKDVSLLAFLHVVEAVTEVVSLEASVGVSEQQEIRQTLIREASKHVAEL